MVVGAAASAAALFCTSEVGWSWQIGVPSWATSTTLAYVTFGFVCILPLLNTILQKWEMTSVGGGTRGEPLVASLLSYGCYLLLSFMDNQFWKVDEAVWINGTGGLFYAVYLMLFLIFVDHADHQLTLMMSVQTAVCYFSFTIAVGVLSGSIVALKWICMLAGVVSACAPLLLALFVEEKYVENLPDCFSSVSGLVYYLVWTVRACTPKLDLFDLVTNASGTLCSVVFVVLLFKWKNQHKPAAEQADGIAAPLIEQNGVPARQDMNLQDPVKPRVNLQGADPHDPAELLEQHGVGAQQEAINMNQDPVDLPQDPAEQGGEIAAPPLQQNGVQPHQDAANMNPAG